MNEMSFVYMPKSTYFARLKKSPRELTECRVVVLATAATSRARTHARILLANDFVSSLVLFACWPNIDKKKKKRQLVIMQLKKYFDVIMKASRLVAC